MWWPHSTHATRWCLLPPLTSTVKWLSTHAHSTSLSLAARLHRCRTNCSHYVNNDCAFPGQTSSIHHIKRGVLGTWTGGFLAQFLAHTRRRPVGDVAGSRRAVHQAGSTGHKVELPWLNYPGSPTGTFSPTEVRSKFCLSKTSTRLCFHYDN